jgi:hypothetical protein
MKVDDLLHLPFDEYMQTCAQRHHALCNSTPVHRIIANQGGYEGQQFAHALWMREWYENRARTLEDFDPITSK